MNNMLPLLLLLRDNDSKTASSPTLAPRIQTAVDELNQVNDLIDLVAKMGLEELAPIPTEWNIPAGGLSDESMDKIIENMESNPGKLIENHDILGSSPKWTVLR